MSVSVRVREYVWSAHSVVIQLKRHDSIQQRAPLENKVMQIAFSDIFQRWVEKTQILQR